MYKNRVSPDKRAVIWSLIPPDFIDRHRWKDIGKSIIVGTTNQIAELHRPLIPTSFIALNGIQNMPQIAPAYKQANLAVVWVEYLAIHLHFDN